VLDCYALTCRTEIVLQYAAGRRKRGEHTQLTLLDPSQATRVTLANMIPQSFQESFKEEEHMQPVLIGLLRTALLAAGGDCILLDTHKSSNQLHGPIARPDGIFAASGPKPLWTQVVSLLEFKISDSKTDIETMFGQQIERCRHVFHNNKDRNMVSAINITMNTLEVVTVERQAHEGLKVTRTGRQPFSISPESRGFQLLVQCLLTPKIDLGFVETQLPAVSELGSCSFAVVKPIKQGSAQQGSGSWVFSATVASHADAILKLNTVSTEVSRHACCKIQMLAPHCVFCQLKIQSSLIISYTHFGMASHVRASFGSCFVRSALAWWRKITAGNVVLCNAG